MTLKFNIILKLNQTLIKTCQIWIKCSSKKSNQEAAAERIKSPGLPISLTPKKIACLPNKANEQKAPK